jgi:hypothetical protein
MSTFRLLDDARLAELDRLLLALGARECDPATSVARPAWPPQRRLTPRGLFR